MKREKERESRAVTTILTKEIIAEVWPDRRNDGSVGRDHLGGDLQLLYRSFATSPGGEKNAYARSGERGRPSE